jgi:dodecin
MPGRTYKLIELVGISDKSFADATNNAVKKAAESLQGLAWFEVVEQRGSIKNGRVGEYQVKLNVAFRLMGSDELAAEGAAPKRRGR